MGKEKIYGGLIFLLALLLILYYTWGLVLLPLFPALAAWVDSIFATGTFLNMIFHPSWEMLVIIPIYLAAVLIGLIAMWIGYTMLTTPAPEPLEDFDFDEEEVTEEKPEESTE